MLRETPFIGLRSVSNPEQTRLVIPLFQTDKFVVTDESIYPFHSSYKKRVVFSIVDPGKVKDIMGDMVRSHDALHNPEVPVLFSSMLTDLNNHYRSPGYRIYYDIYKESPNSRFTSIKFECTTCKVHQSFTPFGLVRSYIAALNRFNHEFCLCGASIYRSIVNDLFNMFLGKLDGFHLKNCLSFIEDSINNVYSF